MTMKIPERVAFGCLLLLFTFQTHTAFQLCPASGSGTICVQRSTKTHQNIVTLVCAAPVATWGDVEFFRTNDRRIVSNDFPTERAGDFVYMVLDLSPSTEGMYVCRSVADNNIKSINNVTLLAYPEVVAYSNEVRVLRGQGATLVCPFILGPLSLAASPSPVSWTYTILGGQSYAYPGTNLTLPNAMAGTYTCYVSTQLGNPLSRNISLVIYVDLAIISYSQSTRAVDNTATVVNSFECQVQYGSTPDKGKPDATWYINNVPLHSVPGSGRFTKYGLSTTSVDGVNNTARSILSVNNGLVQDSGVYECRFDWIGYSVSHKFYFAIIGKPTLSILTSSEGHLYLNVSLYSSSLHQPWQLLVRFSDTTSPAMTSSITLNGIDSSPSLYLVPPSQLPSSFSAYTVAVAVMVGDTTGPYSSEVTTNGLSPSCDLEALVTQNPKMSSLAISLIATWLLISLAVVGVIGYCCARKHPKQGQSSGSQDTPHVVDADCCGSPDNNNKEPLMTEFCWQAKVLEGGLSDVMERRNSTLKRMLSPSDNEPWQCHVRRCSSVTYRALPGPPSPSPSSRDIHQNLNSSYGLACRQENAYADLDEVRR
eukprot:Em0005g263a